MMKFITKIMLTISTILIMKGLNIVKKKKINSFLMIVHVSHWLRAAKGHMVRITMWKGLSILIEVNIYSVPPRKMDGWQFSKRLHINCKKFDIISQILVNHINMLTLLITFKIFQSNPLYFSKVCVTCLFMHWQYQ